MQKQVEGTENDKYLFGYSFWLMKHFWKPFGIQICSFEMILLARTKWYTSFYQGFTKLRNLEVS